MMHNISELQGLKSQRTSNRHYQINAARTLCLVVGHVGCGHGYINALFTGKLFLSSCMTVLFRVSSRAD